LWSREVPRANDIKTWALREKKKVKLMGVAERKKKGQRFIS